jgi:hypothetical protein
MAAFALSRGRAAVYRGYGLAVCSRVIRESLGTDELDIMTRSDETVATLGLGWFRLHCYMFLRLLSALSSTSSTLVRGFGLECRRVQ